MKLFSKVTETVKTVIKPELFSEINGRDDIKVLLKHALHASRPVHVLLKGPPGTGKTAFLKSIENYYGRRAVYLDFTSASKAGTLTEIVAKRPKIILIDELEKAPKDVTAGMLGMMEDGRIKYTLKREKIEEDIDAVVIATCNHMDELAPEFLDRMIEKDVPAYTEDQFYEVAQYSLSKMNIKADLAHYIAEQVLARYGLSKLRKCIQIGAMAKTVQDVDAVLGVM